MVMQTRMNLMIIAAGIWPVPENHTGMPPMKTQFKYRIRQDTDIICQPYTGARLAKRQYDFS
jgi:hypothetical protein